MNNAVILHGKPTKERYLNPDIPKPHEANWFPWIGQRLSERGILTAIPPLPRPYFPVYEDWRNVFEREHVNHSTALVGHSAGAEFLLRWLSSNKNTVIERLVLVAPYRDKDEKYGDFSKYDLDKTLPERVGRLTVIYSSDDDDHIVNRSEQIIQELPTSIPVALNGYGHFRIGHNMIGPEFPELLEALTE